MHPSFTIYGHPTNNSNKLNSARFQRHISGIMLTQDVGVLTCFLYILVWCHPPEIRDKEKEIQEKVKEIQEKEMNRAKLIA